MKPVLYSFRRCPYAMRARMAVWEAGLEVELREVVLRNKPPELLEASPKGTVPVLVLAERVIEESLEIMLHVLPPKHAWLQSKEQDLARIALCDGAFKHHLDRAKYGTRYPGEDPREHRDAAEAILGQWEGVLQRGHLSEQGTGLADVAIMPFVRQLANHDRKWFDALPMPSLQRWLADWLESPTFTRVMMKLPPWSAD